MIKFQATATIRSISGVIAIPSKTGGDAFQKRELVLDDSWDKEGKHYENLILIEFSGDKMAMLDSFWQGQRVTVECILSGRESNGRIFNTVRGQSMMLAQQPQQQYSQPAPMPGGQYDQRQMPSGYPPQPGTPAYPQQQYPPQQQYIPPSAPTGMPPQAPPPPQQGQYGYNPPYPR